MQLLASGKSDLQTFDELYAKYHKAVYLNIKKLIEDEETALDILQEVFMSLWENREKLDFKTFTGGWLFVVSYNKSISHLRKKVSDSIDYSDNVTEIQADENKDWNEQVEIDYLMKLQVLEEAVDVLPNRKKQVFQMCRFEGRSKEEVAEQLQLSTDTVKDYLKQSNQMIRRYILAKYPSLLSLSAYAAVTDYFC